MATKEECFAIGNRCNFCVGIGETALASAYEAKHPSLPSGDIVNIVENSRVRAEIEDQAGITALSCENRRELARKIGTRLGSTI